LVIIVSILINFSEIRYDYSISTWLKALIFIVLTFTPFIVGVVSFKTLRKQLHLSKKTVNKVTTNIIKKLTNK